MTLFIITVATCLGACLGSFLGVVLWRMPRGESLTHPPSHCNECNARLAPSELIPVVSWLAQQGHCRHCGARIPAGALAIEVGGALVLGGATALLLLW